MHVSKPCPSASLLHAWQHDSVLRCRGAAGRSAPRLPAGTPPDQPRSPVLTAPSAGTRRLGRSRLPPSHGSAQNGGKRASGGAGTALKRWEGRHRKRALGHRRHGLAFPSRYDETSVLFVTVSGTRIVSAFYIGLRAVCFIY